MELGFGLKGFEELGFRVRVKGFGILGPRVLPQL